MTSKSITRTEVRAIAREESNKAISNFTKELEEVKTLSENNSKILARLERLLLGEEGVDEDDILKNRINFAYRYAKLNTESRIIERAKPALEWFEDMNEIEVGCKESKLESLGKLITFYLNIRWILGIIGVTTVINSLPILNEIIKWVEKVVEK